VPKDDPTYPYLKAMQDAGASYTDEKVILSQQNGWEGRSYGQLFRYSGADEYVLDPASQNKAGTRLAGVAQAGLGVAGVVASSTLCTTGLGCVATAIAGPVSADYAQAGARQAITGNATTPYGGQVLQSLGLSPQAAAYTYAALGIAPTLANALALNKAAAEISKYSQLARASYSEFTTQGIEVTPAVLATPQVKALSAELRVANPDMSAENVQRIVNGIVSSGSNLPIAATASFGSVLVKIVSKGEGVSSYTPFWMSPEQARATATMTAEQAS